MNAKVLILGIVALGICAVSACHVSGTERAVSRSAGLPAAHDTAEASAVPLPSALTASHPLVAETVTALNPDTYVRTDVIVPILQDILTLISRSTQAKANTSRGGADRDFINKQTDAIYDSLHDSVTDTNDDLSALTATVSDLSTLTDTTFVQDGNAFGSLATLGTIDDYGLSLVTSGTDRLRILDNGKIGIGTTNPGAALAVKGSPVAEDHNPSIIENGSFDTDMDGWDLEEDSCAVWNDDALTLMVDETCNGEEGASLPFAFFSPTLTPDEDYTLTFTVSHVTGDGPSVFMLSGGGSPEGPFGEGTHAIHFTAGHDGTAQGVFSFGSASIGDAFTISDVSFDLYEGPKLAPNEEDTFDQLMTTCPTWHDGAVRISYLDGGQDICSDPIIAAQFETEAGETYTLTFTVSDVMNDEVGIGFDQNGEPYDEGPFGNGTHTVTFTTDYTGTETLEFWLYDLNNFSSFTIDDISLYAESSAVEADPIFIAEGSDGSEKLRLTGGGLLGIGTDEPSAALTVKGTTGHLGSERVTNGTFDEDADGWELNDCALWNDGITTITYTACDNPYISTEFESEAGETYTLTFTVSDVSNDQVYFYFDQNGESYNEGPFGEGTHTVTFPTDYTGTDIIYFELWDWNEDASLSIDDVSIRKGSPAPIFTAQDSGGDSVLHIAGNGFVGIGTDAPTDLLTVNGSASFDGHAYFNDGIEIGGNSYVYGTVNADCFSTDGGNTCLGESSSGSSAWTTSDSDIYYNDGNVGIGTTTPNSELTVAGDIQLTGALRTSGSFTVYNNTFPVLTINNVAGQFFGGESAGYSSTNASYSNFIGTGAGYDTASITDSNFIGRYAGYLSTNASYSNFIGFQAGYSTQAAHSNFFGQNVGIQATYADNSNFLGQEAGYQAVNAASSNFLGFHAGYSASNASYSNFIGYGAGASATNALNSNFLGNFAGIYATNASSSNFFGPDAGNSATFAAESNFFGVGAGSNAMNAARSIFIGNQSGSGDTVDNTGDVASSSIAIGNYSGTGGFSNSIALGQGVLNSAAAQLNVGNVLYANGIYTGTTPTSDPMTDAKFGIGTSTPTATLTVSGTVRFAGLGSGSLQTDALGNVTVSSDERLKDLHDPFTRGIADLLKIDPITYTWKPETGYDTETLYTGFSAQNVQAAIPEAVATDTRGYLTLSDRPILAAVVNAIKEIYTRMEEYFTKNDEEIEELKERIRVLEALENIQSPDSDDEGSAVEEPVVEDPAEDTPAVDEPAVETPVTDEPVVEEPPAGSEEDLEEPEEPVSTESEEAETETPTEPEEDVETPETPAVEDPAPAEETPEPEVPAETTAEPVA
jgi:hypothetical protein